MGQIQNKYHVTNDGMIFSVLSDGSVKEIGKVEQILKGNEKKMNIWLYISIIFFIGFCASIMPYLKLYNRYNFPETTIYYGQEGDPEDGEYVKMFFWKDGTCKIFEDNICESRECGGTYYIENDIIHVTWGDNTNEAFDISNDSFSRYGMTISRIYE